MLALLILYIYNFIINIIIFLLLTLTIASITLIERKVMALSQRRVGPNYIGYKGRLQFIADAVKLCLKHIFIVNNTNKFYFMLIPVFILVTAYTFWVNVLWLPSLSICEVEYNFLLMGLLSTIFASLLFLISWVTQNKYAILSAYRTLIVTIVLEIFLTFIFLYLLFIFNSFSFLYSSTLQSKMNWTLFVLLPILPALIIVFTLETGRIPFDLGEAEAELIAGHSTEMGGFYFALFYLGEYFHLYCFSLQIVLIIFGGWYF